MENESENRMTVAKNQRSINYSSTPKQFEVGYINPRYSLLYPDPITCSFFRELAMAKR
ncbi:hypothetical protein HAX54_047951, partial [Datura stramonium]|nr:hypothetical protein [Datura stramonium]